MREETLRSDKNRWKQDCNLEIHDATRVCLKVVSEDSRQTHMVELISTELLHSLVGVDAALC